MKTATFKKDLKGWRGHAALYKLSSPVEFHFAGSDDLGRTNFVVVSKVYIEHLASLYGSGVETMIFPSNGRGTPHNFLDLVCIRGEHSDHKEALKVLGYTLEEK